MLKKLKFTGVFIGFAILGLLAYFVASVFAFSALGLALWTLFDLLKTKRGENK